MAKRWGMERHKGFLIVGSVVPRFATGFDWDSQGIIFRSGRLGSTVEIKRIKGPIVSSKDAVGRARTQPMQGVDRQRFVRPPTRRYSTR